MDVSYRWLARHVDLDGIAPEQLAEDLTLSTAEVEGVEPFAPQLCPTMTEPSPETPDAELSNVAPPSGKAPKPTIPAAVQRKA